MDEEATLLRDSARTFLAGQWPADKAVAESQRPESLRRIWGEIGQQGWLVLGAERGELRLLQVLLEELGRAACPAPLIDAFLANALLKGAPAAAGILAALGEGKASVSVALGPLDGDANAGNVSASGKTVSGKLAFVEGASIATHFLVTAGSGPRVALVEAGSASITFTPGHSVPALAEVELHAAPALLVDCDPALLKSAQHLMRFGLASRALGAASRGFDTVVEYAKERVQFGRKIGQFQAIQHKLANAALGLEISRLTLQRAAASWDRSDPQWPYACGVAVSIASPALRQVCLETHHAFGGVSFWEEHEMPRHFRRIHADLARCGGVYAAREEVAGTLLEEEPRIPDLDLGPKANAFRDEVRDWLAQNWDGKFSEEDMKRHLNERLASQPFSRKLAAKGWLGLSWPKQWGGQERSALEQLVFEEEMAYAEAPFGWHLASVNMMGPTIMRLGSPEMRDRMLPAILRGDVCFCIGYSEPANGSDLAGLKTRAVKDGDDWVIRGQKLYTSTASYANYCWLAARTDPDAQPSHAGITVFVVPMDSPGLTLQPLIGLNEHRSNVVFWDDVRVPASAVVGEVNGGWKVITAALAFERIALAGVAARGRAYFDKLVAHARSASRGGRPMRDDPLVRERLATLAAEIEAARLLSVQTAQIVEDGGVPAHEAAMAKIYSGELMERLGEAALDLLGTGAGLRDGSRSTLLDGSFEFCIRDSLMYVIGGGTNEIQRNIVALRGLGLPR
jgi:alkylation response protein AidB-like acyl-CoA dehydrogenase